MRKEYVESAVGQSQSSYSGGFRIRNAMIAGVVSHVLSLILVIASAVFFAKAIKGDNIQSWRIVVAMVMTAYSITCLLSSYIFIVHGMIINKRINEVTGKIVSVWADTRIVFTQQGFIKELDDIPNRVSVKGELFFVKFHQRIYRLVDDESFSWIVQFILSPFVLAPCLFSFIFVPIKSSANARAGKNTDDAFRLAHLDAEEIVKNRFVEENDYAKEIITVLFCLYYVLKRGYVLDVANRAAPKTSAFLGKYDVDRLETLFMGSNSSRGNVSRLVNRFSEIISERDGVAISYEERYAIANIFEMELCLKYIEEGEDALILSKSNQLAVNIIKKICFVLLIPVSIMAVVYGAFVRNTDCIMIGLLLFGGSAFLLLTKFCMKDLGNIRSESFKMLSVLYLPKRYRRKLSKEIVKRVKSGAIQSQYRNKCLELIKLLRKTEEEPKPLAPIKHKVVLYTNIHITPE